MWRAWRILWRGSAILLVLFVAWIVFARARWGAQANIGAAFLAKQVCSCHFVGGRDAEWCRRDMSGWQFDSGVLLLRGSDAPPGAEVRFLPFLNSLCEANPDLHVYILAWDFHVVLALEREWMQRVYFDWMTNPRFRFLFDNCPAPGGSHHQKFVVVDGTHDVSHPGQTLNRLRPPHRRDGEQCDVIELRLVESLSYGPARM